MFVPFCKVLNLRGPVVKEACRTFSKLVEAAGAMRCSMLLREVFPCLLEARGSSNKVQVQVEFKLNPDI